MEPKTTVRPWGNFRQFTHNEPTTVKILTVNTGEAFSLQYHHHRREFWRVLSGDPHITVGEKTTVAKPGDEFLIKEEEKHRITAGKEPAVILEVAFGAFDEADIVRTEDRYGRA